MSTIDERGLVEAHKAGDEAAFASIVRNYYSELLSHARRRLGEPKAAEDAVQEALLRAFRALPRFNGDYKLGAWLHRIVENVCADEGNRRRREADVVDRIAALPTGTTTAGSAESASLPSAGIDAALSHLSPSYRQAVVLRYVHGLPYREVAAAAGVSEENARARVHRARSVLRRLLGGPTAVFVWFGATIKRSRRAHGVDAAAVRLSGSATQLAGAVSAIPGKTAFATRVASLVAAAAMPVASAGLGSTIDWLRDHVGHVEQSDTSAAEGDARVPSAIVIATESLAGTPMSVSVTTAGVHAGVRPMDGDTERWGWFQPDTGSAPAGESGSRESGSGTLTADLKLVKVEADGTRLSGRGVLEAPDGLVRGSIEVLVSAVDDRRPGQPVRADLLFYEDGGRSQPLRVNAQAAVVEQSVGDGVNRYRFHGAYRASGHGLGLDRHGSLSFWLQAGSDPSSISVGFSSED